MEFRRILLPVCVCVCVGRDGRARAVGIGAERGDSEREKIKIAVKQTRGIGTTRLRRVINERNSQDFTSVAVVVFVKRPRRTVTPTTPHSPNEQTLETTLARVDGVPARGVRAGRRARCRPGAARAICRYRYTVVRLVNITPSLTGRPPPRSPNKLEMRQIARGKEETRKCDASAAREESQHAEEYRKCDAEEGSSGREEWNAKNKWKKKDKVEDEEGERERVRRGGRTEERERERATETRAAWLSRMARSYSLGYNSAVLGQCELNESFSPRRPHPFTPPRASACFPHFPARRRCRCSPRCRRHRGPPPGTPRL